LPCVDIVDHALVVHGNALDAGRMARDHGLRGLRSTEREEFRRQTRGANDRMSVTASVDWDANARFSATGEAVDQGGDRAVVNRWKVYWREKESVDSGGERTNATL
jgi:hypothetical protein